MVDVCASIPIRENTNVVRSVGARKHLGDDLMCVADECVADATRLADAKSW